MEHVLIIQQASIGDLAIVKNLAHQIWPVTYGHILSPTQLQYMLELNYSLASLKKQMKEQGHVFLIARLNSEPVGFASFAATAKPGVYKLQKIYVSTTIQGKGLGKALIDAVIKEIQPLHAVSLQLNVNRHNQAVTFYQKFGFVIIKEEDIDIGNGYFMNDYVMEKKL